MQETQLTGNLLPWEKLHWLCSCVLWQFKRNVKGLNARRCVQTGLVVLHGLVIEVAFLHLKLLCMLACRINKLITNLK